MTEVFPFPKLNSPVIIAMKGLPCTAKSELGIRIGKWATSPVLYIDHFLDVLSLERGYTAESLPSPDEAERLHRLAFDALCKPASHNLRWGADNRRWSYNGVIIKSRLSSTFELDRLVQLARGNNCGKILIIEFYMKNEYRFRLRLERKVKSGEHKEWYKARSWKDIEKAMDDQDGDDDWDLHLRRLLDNGDGFPRVTRLVFDPFDDLYLDPPARLSNGSLKIITTLLHRLEVEQDSNEEDLLLYEVVQYRELRQSLAEKQIRDASSYSEEGQRYLCGRGNESIGVCVFKYWEELPDDKGKAYYCGVCEERVISGYPAYSCIFCFLILHKSCAEMPNGVAFKGFEDIRVLRDYPIRHLPRHACKSCSERGEGFSLECVSCLFQTHLKCRVLPTILKHECHDHFLSLCFSQCHKCKACGTDRGFEGLYGCYICLMDYDIECASQLGQVEHAHGGHEHVLKLAYSHGVEKEEGYWCDVCFEDMDPQNWFYTCQHCPYYVVHPNCVRLSGGRRLTANSSFRSE